MLKAVPAETNEFGAQLAATHITNQYYSRFDEAEETTFNSHLNSRGRLQILQIVS
jgi:hypothetical protein